MDGAGSTVVADAAAVVDVCGVSSPPSTSAPEPDPSSRSATAVVEAGESVEAPTLPDAHTASDMISMQKLPLATRLPSAIASP